jgi:hypothetical protein
MVWIPVLGVLLFLALYFIAASLYPGGTRTDHATRGYGHLSNYWCDLLDRVSYSGLPNPGYPFALIGTVVLPLSLISFWVRLPHLFRATVISGRIVAIAGPLAMLAATLIFTAWHDLTIRIAVGLGFSAFISAELGLARSERPGLALLGLFPLALGLTNFAMWQSGELLVIMPAVQKAAYASFFVWVVVCSLTPNRKVKLNRGSKRS